MSIQPCAVSPAAAPWLLARLGPLLVVACAGCWYPAGSVSGFGSGYVTAESPETANPTSMPARIYVTELLVPDNPQWQLVYRDRPITDEEWDSAVGNWRDEYAQRILHEIQPNHPSVEIVFVADDRIPSSGLLLSSRLHHTEPFPEPPWGYFSLSLTDLEAREEIYYARIEVPEPFYFAHEGWVDELLWMVASYTRLIEPVFGTGRLNGIKLTEVSPWNRGRVMAAGAEMSFWVDTFYSGGGDLGPEGEAARAARFDALDRAGEEAANQLDPFCRLFGAADDGCLELELDAYNP
jgi:hypothetical protein